MNPVKLQFELKHIIYNMLEFQYNSQWNYTFTSLLQK